MLASRLPRQPKGTCSLDGAGQECIAGRQEFPASRDFDISVLGIPLTVLARVDVEMLPGQRFRVERGHGIVHA